MTEKELDYLNNFVKEYCYKEELKDIYLREILNQNKEY